MSFQPLLHHPHASVSPANYVIAVTYDTIIITMKPPFPCDNINHVHVYCSVIPYSYPRTGNFRGHEIVVIVRSRVHLRK